MKFELLATVRCSRATIQDTLENWSHPDQPGCVKMDGSALRDGVLLHYYPRRMASWTSKAPEVVGLHKVIGRGGSPGRMAEQACCLMTCVSAVKTS